MRRASHVIAVLVLLAVLLMGIGTPSYSQAEPFPPVVIDVWPQPGVELLPTDPLTITFDQPMDRPTVEAALAFAPALTGLFTWIDAQTVEFKPDGGWPREQVYESTVKSSAAAVNGLKLESPYRFKVQTLGPLAVAQVSPASDTENVSLDAKIVVNFNRAVLALTAEGTASENPAPLTFEPAIAGKGEWVNESLYVFTPSELLRRNTRYTVRLDALTSVDGARMHQPFTWSFTAKPPDLPRISVRKAGDGDTADDLQKVPLDYGIRVSFAQPMDRDSVEAAFSLTTQGKSILGSFTWEPDSTALTFKPRQLLALDTAYTVTVQKTAKMRDDSVLSQDTQLAFHTQPHPRVVASTPRDGATGVSAPATEILLIFNVPMNVESVKNSLEIVPRPDSIQSNDTTYSDQVWLSFRSQPKTTYTITLKASAVDTYGNLLREDYTFSFTTEDSSPEPPPGKFRPRINGGLMITGAAQKNTQVIVDFWGGPEAVEMRLYRFPPGELGGETLINDQIYTWGLYYTDPEMHNCKAPPVVKPSNLIRTWQETYDPDKDQEDARAINLASPAGGKLAPGLYWVTMGSTIRCSVDKEQPKKGTEVGPQWQFGLAVVTANLTTKRGTEDIFVWLTSLESTAPVPGAEVIVWAEGKVIASGITAADGTAKVPVRLQEHQMILITAEKPGTYAAWYNNWLIGAWRQFDGEARYDRYIVKPSYEEDYIYTDRPIYRPGDTIYYRGVVRDKRDMVFPVSEKRTAYLKIEKYDENYDFSPLVNTKVALTAFGTFSGEYTIPADAPLTDLYITVQLEPDSPDEETACGDYYYYGCNTAEHATVSVRVAAYQPAAFEVVVKPEQPVIAQGETIDATIQGLYYFGGMVKNAKVTWQTYRGYASFHYSGPGRYTFDQQSDYDGYFSYYAEGYDYDDYEYVYPFSSGDAVMDSQGRAAIHVETKKSDTNYAYPVRYVVEGTVQDETGTTVSGRVSVVAHPANLYIGIGERPGTANPSEAVPLDLIAVTPDSQPRPHQALTLTVEGYQSAEGSWKTYQTKNLVTDSSGKTHVVLEPLLPGFYWIQAEGRDEKGHTSISRLYLWVPDSVKGIEYGWMNANMHYLGVLPDRREYRPGDVAQILIPVPFEGPSKVLLTSERAGVISHVVLEANGKPLVYSLLLTDADSPTTYIQAVYLAPVSAENPRPRFRVSVPFAISVAPVKALLDVQVTPSKTQAKPGDSVTFDVRVTDSEGKPVVAEVGLKLVDKAVLALLSSNSTTLQRAFYYRQGRYMYTDLSLDGLLESPGEAKEFSAPALGGGGDGDGGEAQPDIRQNYKTTPLWAPHVVTDANGRAQVTVTLPDNLTTWELDARALTMDMKVGQATTEIMTSLPLVVQPVTPRFLVAGDHVQLAAIIHNQTNKDQAVKASLTAEGVHLDGQATQQVLIPADSRVRVTWFGVVDAAAGADLVFQAAGDGVSDAAKPALTTGPGGTIPILRYMVPDAPAGTAGVLRAGGSAVVTVTLPPRLKANEGDLTLRVEPSLAATITDSFTYLRQFPHYCIEQTVSRFLPNLTTYRALADLGQSDPALETALKQEMDEALTKLVKEQKNEGGWGWYPSMAIDPLTSAYAALGLIELQRAGYTVDADMLNRAVAYVKSQSVQLLGVPDWQLNRLVFYLYVLARDGQGDKSALDALATLHTRLSYAGRAFLLMAYHERFPDAPQVNLLVSDLLSGASYTSDGTYWDEASTDWWNWGTDTRATALALTALIRVMPQSNLLPDVVRWLIAARTVDHWPTTQETVWGITALTEWMVLTGELKGQYTYNLSLNRQALGKGAVTPATIRKSTTVRVALRDLLVANRLIVARGEGTGALYYAAQLQLYTPADQAKALNRGIGLRREYFLKEANIPVTAAHIGDAITVRLTITLSQDVYYFALEDHVPAGTEPIDISLLTATLGEQNEARYERWYWGWWYFRQQELRDTGMHLYADYLPAGTYVFTYQVRAAVAGEFQVIPTQAYTFYASDIFGRTGGLLFKIE